MRLISSQPRRSLQDTGIRLNWIIIVSDHLFMLYTRRWKAMKSYAPMITIAQTAHFFTVTVGGFADYVFIPGQADPVTGGKIFSALHEKLLNTRNAQLFRHLSGMAARIGHVWGQMSRTRDSTSSWWDKTRSNGATEAAETTTYSCDSALGSPKLVDCAQLQYTAFPKGGEASLQISPEEPTFLHSASCSIGISSLVPMRLTWSRIEAAINDLIEICVNHPLTAVGGRAYYGQQQSIDIGGWSSKDELRKRNVTGLDALPPAANIALFQQVVPLPPTLSAADERNGCTWQQAVHSGDIRRCSHHHQSRPSP
ncbi:MAG: hypothetical protein HETSPECPRED_002352 [Heterodermia speciosa]|uniref:Uncharacterized protein n=1 Tax=Heterodermia speciosa TaxID=116794 RepID=A0A8H3IE95_9LECA|nr:MAG: hypothetical protein HETSPECPRED_002352 [Heterodermia speciosa]